MSTNYGLFKSKFKKAIADATYNEIITKTARYYHFLGKENAWTDFLSPFIPSSTSDVPGAPSDNFRYELHVRRDILTTKLITPSDVSYIIPRINWEYGTVYDMYDDALSATDPAPSGATRIEDAHFYVMTVDYNVYKCLWNNDNKPSTISPTGTSAFTFTLADGYIWKFMYTIPISLRNRFLSYDYMPISTALKNQFYSDGEIIQVIVEDGGQNYSSGTQLVVTGDGYIADNPYVISDITITNAGAGYSSTPAVTFDLPTVISGFEYQATASVTILSGHIATKTLLTSGYGYTSDPIAPTITVAPPVAGATAWIANHTYALNDKISYNGNFYNVSTAGTTATTAPTHTTGAVANGTATLTYVGTQAVLTPVMVKTEADLDVVLTGGEITGIIINDGGIGYTHANIQIIDSTGTGGILTANFNTGNVDTLQANVELLAVSGTIEAMKIVDGGSGYGAASVTILGDGTGATADAIVEAGKVSKIVMTNVGSGYTWTDVIINGNGTGAIARAIMSPLKGHGHNAVDELNANSIMFYSSISRDRNQGLIVNNDYRKAGLLKNITQFGSTQRFNKDIGSGCVLITGIFDVSKFAYDQLLVQANAPYKKYRIVEFTPTQILISVFNNFTINIGDTLINEQGYTVGVTAVKERTIDQFSGDFLFLTVREPFAPSEEQIITVRTVLTI